MTVTDVHAHIVTPGIVAAAEAGRELFGMTFAKTPEGRLHTVCGERSSTLPWPDFTESIEQRIANMDAIGVDKHVVSLSPVLYLYGLDPAQAVPFARSANDEIGEILAGHPDRFHGFGYVPLQSPGDAVRETERVMSMPGFVGISMLTNAEGTDLDDPALFPVFEAAAATGALVFIHPRGGIRASGFGKYHLRNLIGNPLETTLAFANLVFGGVLDRLPDLQVLLAHGGGYACLGIGRFDHGHSVRPETVSADVPSAYLRRVYVDSLVHAHETLRLVVDRVGSSRVMLASDYPADMGQPDPAHWLRESATLTEAEKDAILGANFEAFLASRSTGRTVAAS